MRAFQTSIGYNKVMTPIPSFLQWERYGSLNDCFYVSRGQKAGFVFYGEKTSQRALATK